MISTKDKVSIYIHWPFCKSKCPYCDFNSHISDNVNDELWLVSFIKELDYYKDYLSDKRIISIFFGGGTPSLAHESVIGGLIDYIAKNHDLDADAEITMEANPTSIEINKFKYIAANGVNRLSIGVQSFNDSDLKFLGRHHSSNQAMKAIEVTRKYFNKYSFDLIYALPNQTLHNWVNELNNAMQLLSGHLSAYQLTIEKGTKFYSSYQKKEFIMPDCNLAADMYLVTEEILNNANYNNYEISNYAMDGFESLHNLQYWRYGDYVGIGPGAHGRISKDNKRMSTQNISSPTAWLDMVEKKGIGLQRNEVLSQTEINTERLMMGLRTSEGVEINQAINFKHIEELVNAGLLVLVKNKIIATLQGRLLLNSVISHLI